MVGRGLYSPLYLSCCCSTVPYLRYPSMYPAAAPQYRTAVTTVIYCCTASSTLLLHFSTLLAVSSMYPTAVPQVLYCCTTVPYCCTTCSTRQHARNWESKDDGLNFALNVPPVSFLFLKVPGRRHIIPCNWGPSSEAVGGHTHRQWCAAVAPCPRVDEGRKG